MASANKQVICEELMRLAAQDRDVLVLCSDSRGSGSMTDFAKAFPRQFVEVGIAEQDLVGKVFVITGSLTHFENRNQLKELIESRGGQVTGSVSAKTSYLINNDVNSTSSKNKKAKSLDVPIISEEDFLGMIGQ